MKSYLIEVGYCNGKQEEAEAYLLEKVKNIREHYFIIVDEALNFEDLDKYKLNEFAKMYDPSIEDQTITIDKNPESEKMAIRQVASGYEDDRAYKEALRRAFVRLILKEMHLKKYEININVF
jgi:hypothetical protein